jgi:hypothetical protein
MSGHVSALYEFIIYKCCHALATEILPYYKHRLPALLDACYQVDNAVGHHLCTVSYRSNIAPDVHYIILASLFQEFSST